MTTICLGPIGSFSEDALHLVSKQLGIGTFGTQMVEDNADIIPALLKQEESFAVSAMHTSSGRVEVPFEGLVSILDLIQRPMVPFAIDMTFEFSLLACPGVKQSQLKGVVAHAKAIKACPTIVSTFLQSHTVSSNSLAAQMVAEGGEYEGWATLASRRCGDLYGLRELQSNVSDRQAQTSFYAFANGISFPVKQSNKWRVLSVFDLLNVPGSLARVLNSVRKFQMTHIYSAHQSEGNYRFIVELETVSRKDALICADALYKNTQKAAVFTFPVLSV